MEKASRALLIASERKLEGYQIQYSVLRSDYWLNQHLHSLSDSPTFFLIGSSCSSHEFIWGASFLIQKSNLTLPTKGMRLGIYHPLRIHITPIFSNKITVIPHPRLFYSWILFFIHLHVFSNCKLLFISCCSLCSTGQNRFFKKNNLLIMYFFWNIFKFSRFWGLKSFVLYIIFRIINKTQ